MWQRGEYSFDVRGEKRKGCEPNEPAGWRTLLGCVSLMTVRVYVLGSFGNIVAREGRPSKMWQEFEFAKHEFI